MSALEQTECPECSQIIHYQPQRWKAQVVCSNCQATFAVEAAQPPNIPSAENIPIPSHLQGQPTKAEEPSTAIGDGDSSETFRYQRSKVTGTMVSVFLIILVLVGIGGGIAALAMLDSNSEKKAKQEREENADKGKKIQYMLAGKKRGKVAGVEVGIKFVEYGPIRVKDQQSVVHESSESLIQIYLDIRSRRNNQTRYVSWYGNSFDRNGTSQVATLTDENGNICEMPVFDDVTGVLGHTANAIMERNQRIEDCLIFELPANVKITEIKELRLALPMENIGNSGEIYFRIPLSDIRLVSKESGD